MAGIVYARHHRELVASEYADVINEQARTPADVRKLKDELADMDLTRTQLQRELDGRMKFVSGLKSENFYLSVDTKTRKLRFYYGGTVLREADITLGEPRTIKSQSKSWTFLPVKGAFPVEAKLVGYDWPIPDWVYAMNNQPVPATRAVVHNGLGGYVILLPNGYAIHSPPADDSPL
ncbi:MAG TPA: hypothetical protein VJZ00_22255, partial [Thermoanaerobaculia bacterium]|nr:hypothetical protein [Thermoanaerobaculia bacterium]